MGWSNSSAASLVRDCGICAVAILWLSLDTARGFSGFGVRVYTLRESGLVALTVKENQAKQSSNGSAALQQI
jgi:predicted Fe-Mo cluster-binding NifX family protein